MKPKLMHQHAMDLSFQAKQALLGGNEDLSFDLYCKAAKLESEVASFYFDKPDLEPTRSIIIRSAAFLNLKAGDIAEAKKFIFYGLLNFENEEIKIQLNDALELAMSMQHLAPEDANKEFTYINLLRQKSISYIIEPANNVFGHSVSLNMIKDFSESFLKSIKAFAITTYKKQYNITTDLGDHVKKQIEKIVNPLVTNSAYGSFKFSIANDFMARQNEENDIIELKSKIVNKYHNEIFTNPLTELDIEKLKNEYTDVEMDEIFKPLTKIKSPNADYKIGFYSNENFEKHYLPKIVNKQRCQLIINRQLNEEDIGELENSIIHKTKSLAGKTSKTVIHKESLKSYESSLAIKIIEPKDRQPIVLNEEISLIFTFDSEKGFTFSFYDLAIEFTATKYQDALNGFYNLFYKKIKSVVNKKEKNSDEEKEFDVIKKMINNLDGLKE
jgi:hypothetical protein